MPEPEPRPPRKRARPLRAADRPLRAADRPLRAADGPAVRTRARPRPKPAPRSRVDAPAELVCYDVSVRFGGLSALDTVTLEVRTGEIVGLIGPNGAGKTTLMECVSGFQSATTGRIVYRGIDLLHLSPGERA